MEAALTPEEIAAAKAAASHVPLGPTAVPVDPVATPSAPVAAAAAGVVAPSPSAPVDASDSFKTFSYDESIAWAGNHCIYIVNGALDSSKLRAAIPLDNSIPLTAGQPTLGQVLLDLRLYLRVDSTPHKPGFVEMTPRALYHVWQENYEGNGDAVTFLDGRRPSNSAASHLIRSSTIAMQELDDGWSHRWLTEIDTPVTEAEARRRITAGRFISPAFSCIRGELKTKQIKKAFAEPEDGNSAFNGEVATFVKKGTEEYAW